MSKTVISLDRVHIPVDYDEGRYKDLEYMTFAQGYIVSDDESTNTVRTGHVMRSFELTISQEFLRRENSHAMTVVFQTFASMNPQPVDVKRDGQIERQYTFRCAFVVDEEFI